MESIRVIMLRNWHFDILNMEHWQIAWDLWLNSWVISEPKEWAFVLIIISFIPLWFTGWIALSLVSWGKLVLFIVTLPWKLFKNFFYKPVKIITTNTGVTPIKKKKSYKEIRPRAVRSAMVSERSELAAAPISIPTVTPALATPKIAPTPVPTVMSESKPTPKNFEHALFKFDDNFDDLDFDIDAFEIDNKKNQEKTAGVQASKSSRIQERDYDDFDTSRDRRDRKDNRSRDREDGKRDRDDGRRQENDYARRSDRRDERNRDRDGEKRSDRREKDRRDDRRDDRKEERREERRDDRRDDRKDERRNDRREDKRDDRRDDRDTDRRKDRNIQATQVPARQPSGSCMDIIKQKGYEVISRVTIKNTVIDYVGVSGDRICLCLLDREPGDWLADEERFNDEEPLWFSESSHRISPVRKIDLAKQALLDKLDNAEMSFTVDAFVVVQIGNIINAEDMFEIWDDLNINVTRIDRGTPKEIKLFARTLAEAEKTIPASKLDKVMKLIRSMS